MESQDIVIINSGKSDLESNLIPAQNAISKSSSKNFRKNIIYGGLAFFLVCGTIFGLYTLANIADVKPVMKASETPQNLLNESQNAESTTLQAGAKKAIKEGPKNEQYVPDVFDIRTQATSLNCNFARIDEMLCTGGNWSYTIASTISNTICGQSIRGQEVALSNQYLLNCSDLVSKCEKISTIQDFENQLNIVANNGIPTSQCVSYNGLKYDLEPKSCNTKCDDGSDIVLSKFKFDTLNDSNDDHNATIMNVKNHIYNVGPVIALVSHSPTLARYSGSDPNGIFVNDKNDETSFGLRTYKIVGWSLAPGNTPIPYWIMANTFSSNWGLNGYIYVNMNDTIIQRFYGYTPQ